MTEQQRCENVFATFLPFPYYSDLKSKLKLGFWLNYAIFSSKIRDRVLDVRVADAARFLHAKQCAQLLAQKFIGE